MYIHSQSTANIHFDNQTLWRRGQPPLFYFYVYIYIYLYRYIYGTCIFPYTLSRALWPIHTILSIRNRRTTQYIGSASSRKLNVNGALLLRLLLLVLFERYVVYLVRDF